MATSKSIKLPAPRSPTPGSLEDTLTRRRSHREFKDLPLSLAELSQLLWAAQGRTAADGGRTAPSAGALYPLEIYVVAGKAETLDPGVYHYRPKNHQLMAVASGDRRRALATAALGQEWMAEGAVVMVLSAVVERTARKYGRRAERYAQLEAGHVSQNIYLQATALDLGTVAVGAFEDAAVREVLGLSPGEQPLYLMPVGKIK